jgi:hypothetical protein
MPRKTQMQICQNLAKEILDKFLGDGETTITSVRYTMLLGALTFRLLHEFQQIAIEVTDITKLGHESRWLPKLQKERKSKTS